MHDSRIEDLLRRTLRDEAEMLSLTVSVGRLERRLAERRRQAYTNRRWLAAAIAAVALTGGIAAVTQLRGEIPPTGATPSPSASPSPLPDSTALLAGYPEATLRLEQSVGPATGPVDTGASTVPGASPTPIEVGRVKFSGPFIIAVACIGQGELVAEVRTPSFDIPYTQAVAPCDGRPVFSEYLAAPIDPSSPGDTINVIVSEGASWRLAVGEYPASLMTPPEFAPVALTEGWNVVSNGGPTLVSTTTGAHVTVPDDATRVGVFVQCRGVGTASLSVTGSAATDLACDTSETHRLEFPAVGGEPLEVNAAVHGERLWIRLIVEADGDIASTYAPAPAIPASVAAAPYAAPDQSVVAFGTIGSNHQTILSMSNARPGTPAGDLLPVARFDEVEGARLELVSVSRGTVLRTLATAPAPALIFDSWADATHEQVFYAMAVESAIEFHRVTTAGTDDTLLATAPRDPTAVKAHLAVDDSVFVVEVCAGVSGCKRTIIDGATAAVRQIDGPAGPVCRILGVVAGTIIEASRPVCSEGAPTDVVAVPLDGGASTVLIDAADASVGDAFIVPTSEGPKLVLLGPVGPDAMPWDVLDVTTGDTSTLTGRAVGSTPLVPADIRLPAGWVLLTGGGLGDFPWQRAFDRPVPILVNLVTGERIELVNLPNWQGNY